ncbi:MAG: DUF3109 family protein [Bacteroidaceae bacterium]|nr:DUF3109 family protein [Bacteroidaceae bacterium]
MAVPPIIQVGDVLVSGDILERRFCCDLDACRGACCIDGDAGAPVTLDEIGEIEERLDDVWPLMSASAQSVIDRQGVAYPDPEGEMVTSIVNGRDCAFACEAHGIGGLPDGCCICALEKLARASGDESFVKPISCALYPIREKTIAGTVCLNYHRWSICRPAELKGARLDLPVYKFLKGPLIRRFGEEWYKELEEAAEAFLKNKE